MPSAEAVVSAYDGMRDEMYVAEEVPRRRSARRALALLKKRHSGTYGRLLDVGCSAGLFLQEARACGWDVTGVEPSRWLAEQARGRLGADVVVCAPFETATLEPSSYDVVTLWDVLEHVTDPEAFLTKAESLLKPGGLLVVNVPNLRSWIARAFGRRWPLLLPEHLFYFSPRSLQLLFSQHGLAEPELRVHPVSFDLGYVMRRLSQHRIPIASILDRFVRNTVLARFEVPLLMGELTAIGRKPGPRAV